ncbi:hypothetical protein HYFRA_00006209 [Hymenoscyphus fraxineus]|uniref:Zn(2)-C6 fungal-type domain-containing protein n=1 Tax=Hymenoscyphus fraxineus TaxID=746836 RepID=A0A9N9Q1D7_9HELO|nr:hypothetical protein HYFRA_00006209 [Hymenoscyphus fraxineus]
MQNHGSKRGRDDVTPELIARKRLRPSVDIASLSPDKLEILSQAASILQVDVSDLANLPKTLIHHPESQKDERSSASSVAFLCQQAPIMEETMHQTSNLTTQMESKEQSEENCRTHADSASDNICDPGFFNLGLIPEQIAGCFAGFTSSASRSSLAVDSEDSIYHDKGMAAADSPLLRHDSMRQVSSSHLTYGIPTLEASTEFDSFYEPSYSPWLLESDFACDNFETNGTGWVLGNKEAFLTQYLSPLSMSYYPENGSKDRLDLMSIGKGHGVGGTKGSLDAPGQGQYLDTVDSGPSGPNQVPKTSHATQRIIATPRRKLMSSDRQKTAETRKLTACVRCRMQRIRCLPDPSNPKGACLTCQKVTKPTMHRLPCLRYKLTDIRLFREGSYAAGREWSHRWSTNTMENITKWASPERKQLVVTQDYGPTTLTFTVREFIPLEGDMLERQWSDNGVIKSVPIPHYAIVDMAEALQVHREFIVNQGAQFFKSILDFNDRLLWDTYDTAIWFSNEATARSVEERELLQMVLQLWVAIRMTTRSLRITGTETLNMPSDLMDASSGMQGKLPIPPVMGAQMQMILCHKLQAPWRSKILTRLQKLTLEQRPEHWFCIYLCTFILLHNCSLLTIHDIGYARKHGLKARHARPDMVKELQVGANVLLAHFHYSCKGERPFTLDWKAESSASMATLDEKQLRVVKNTATYVHYNESKFRKLRSDGKYDNEQYFLAQLYEEEWKPRLSVE